MRITKELREALEGAAAHLIEEGKAASAAAAAAIIADALTRYYVLNEIAGHADFLKEQEPKK